MEIDANDQPHVLFKDLINSGTAFGAQRWITTLRRMCERFACSNVAGLPGRDLGGKAWFCFKVLHLVVELLIVRRL